VVAADLRLVVANVPAANGKAEATRLADVREVLPLLHALQGLPADPGRAFRNPVASHDVDRARRGPTRGRMPAEGGPRHDVVLPHGSVVSEDRAQRHQPAPERLADRDEIRRDVEMLDPPHLPGATEPRLDLVRDKEPSVLVGELAKPAHEILRRDPDARLQGDRLEDLPPDAIRIGDVPEALVLQECETPAVDRCLRDALV